MSSKESGKKSKSIVDNLIDVQTRLRKELDDINAIVARKDTEIIALKVATMKVNNKEPVQIENLYAKNEIFHNKVAEI